MQLYVRSNPSIWVDPSGLRLLLASPDDPFEKEPSKIPGLTCTEIEKEAFVKVFGCSCGTLDPTEKNILQGVLGWVECDGNGGTRVKISTRPSEERTLCFYKECGIDTCVTAHEGYHKRQYERYCPKVCEKVKEGQVVAVSGAGCYEVMECLPINVGLSCLIKAKAGFAAQDKEVRFKNEAKSYKCSEIVQQKINTDEGRFKKYGCGGMFPQAANDQPRVPSRLEKSR